MENIKKINLEILKIIFLTFSIIFICPSFLYIIKNKTVFGYNNYYNFFINDGSYKIFSTILYLIIFLCMTIVYILFIKKSNEFKNIKKFILYVAGISIIFVFMMPWTSSDIFYYMGVGELDSKYKQNPYYVTVRDYYEENKENIDDEILEDGAKNVWSGTVVVYGPIAQIIFKILTIISVKNINLCIFLFKLFNLIVHLTNCYLIYIITKKLKLSVIYGLNPFIFIEFIGNVHNDIIMVLFLLLASYFLIKKKM